MRFVSLILLSLLFICSYGHNEFDESDELGVDAEPKVIEESTKVHVEKKYFVPPVLKGDAFFTEIFKSQDNLKTKWVISQAKKDGVDENIAKYDGKWAVEEPDDNLLVGDVGLVLKSKAKHHAIAAPLDKPYEFIGNPLVVQYEVKLQNGLECGGAYIKLLSKSNKLKLEEFNDQTPYTIMFGPDKCGNDAKLHFIFRHMNPLTGEFEEKHAKRPSVNIDKQFSDKKTHLYTLVLNSDNTFQIYVDNTQVNSGSLLEDCTPPVNPPEEIEDPSETKPEDWDEREKIRDPEAVKPDEWDETEPAKIEDTSAVKPAGWLDDEEELLADPEAEKPDDWDEEMDGEWEPPMISNPNCSPGCGEWKPPMIDNPKYKGKWQSPLIDNPAYKGKWKPQIIKNPNYFYDEHPYKMQPIAAIGLELWSMTDGIVFDNFIITDAKSTADEWAKDTFNIKQTEEEAEAAKEGLIAQLIATTNDRPWLWAVYIIVIVLPLILIIIYCCSSSSKDPAADNKKTDESTPDGPEEEEDDEEEDANGEGEDNEEPAKEDEKASPEDEKASPEDESTKKSSKGKAALEKEEEKEDGAGDSLRTSPRRRTARKD
ncbi:PREDICTED: calnexin-like [Priapulus caudatus]|uniref:Calnexin-like n=1 Tax=Priapulus caudatus TaxID=37621 RepID=A0ABM1EBN3_PRICU|nr:PREDICTED: calnexin-like [Priapulus caudatus]XP_014669602.1 PREDICTED: calnexin-like [Priapulus caudatus]XP_014669603.1 PREDICTED: calnexin-like [Priapulus caudatus]XP_014669604.1 PREDICTED: calnexin-like [Priapulus caudatus]